MARRRDTPVVTVMDEAGLPFSKGLMAASIMASGLDPARAYAVAERLETEMLHAGTTSITRHDINEATTLLIDEMVGQRHAELFRKWQTVAELDVPLVVLIGGATGVGKSTIATQLAARLGINRIISTDVIREVMRAMFSEHLMPALHVSSFEGDKALSHPISRSADPVIVGFEEQVRVVAVAVEAIINRSIEEGSDIVIEGAHIVPGWISKPPDAVVVPLVIAIEDEDVHRSHFLMRGSSIRGSDRYLTSFGNIRKIQRYIRTLAQQRGVPVIPSYNLDTTLAAVIEHVISAAISARQSKGTTP